MNKEVIKPQCKLVYITSDDNIEVKTKNKVKYIPTEEKLVRCVPNEGIKLYEIKGTYAKNRPSVSYYFLAANKIEAKQKFLNTMALKITSIREIIDEQEKESILTDITKMPLW